MGDKPHYHGGVGTAGLLGVAFVVLKLCGVIDWDWLWVLAPFWIPLGICLLIVGVALLFYLGVLLWARNQ